eukprot:TRINITY_DN3004_c0_g1_i3.p1 TRINITY_DN3004_c0_g1~~TRINITY_DN3004_c0_g1_i3.p1  ORF type:complete len:518 (-),score=87.91 TRINITY_DN3004_c0_g1_i3:19-1572(-)
MEQVDAFTMDSVDEEMAHTITLEEVAAELAVEDEADLVLGGDEGVKCTYSSGYLPRQAVFSCLTCTPEGEAGFCTACSINCHDGHNVIEIWTRRGFRCDCGNSKFGTMVCKMQADKEPINDHNVYNHNYQGKYCTCMGPYPDPVRVEEGRSEDMMQCCICEDWFHEEHLGLDINDHNVYNHNYQGKYCTCMGPYPDPVRVEEGRSEDMMQCCICEDWFHEEHLGLDINEQAPYGDEDQPVYEDLLCKKCVANRCSFASLYTKYVVKPHTAVVADRQGGGESSGTVPLGGPPKSENTAFQTGGESLGKDVAEVSEKEEEDARQIGTGDFVGNDEAKVGEKLKGGKASLDPPVKCEASVVSGTLIPPAHELGSCSEQKMEEAICPLNGRKVEGTGKPLFMAAGWRDNLCKCQSCLATYEACGVNFLLSEEDTLAHYEDQARKKHRTSEQRFESAFQSQFSRHQQVELLHGFDELKSELRNFMDKMDEEGVTVVTASHVRTFFDQVRRKRQRPDAWDSDV